MNLTKTYLELRKIANNHRTIQIYEPRKRLQNKKKNDFPPPGGENTIFFLPIKAYLQTR